MFEILACHGTCLESRAIEFLSGPRSHTRIRTLYDIRGLDVAGAPLVVKAGSCFEAWDSGVRVIDSWDFDYDKGTVIEVFSLREELTEEQFQLGARFLCRQVGKEYNMPGCKRLALPPGARPVPDYAGLTVWEYPMFFCSEYGAGLFIAMGIPCFNGTPPYDITPQVLPTSLRFNEKPITLTV